MTVSRRIVGLVVAPLVLAGFGAAGLFVGCATTPTPVPVRTFEQPQRMTDVCLGVNEPDGAAAPQVTPVPLGACPPVPPNVVGTPFQNHLFALVTQRSRGQVGVVDLTSGAVVDEDNKTPGTNLIPVGASPSDIVATPDVLLQEGNTGYPPLVFVSSENDEQPSIYAIPEGNLLGTSTGVDAQAPTLTSLLACSLPAPPLALGVALLPSSAGAGSSDAGAGSDGAAGGDGGALPSYVVVALLEPAFAGAQAELMTIDPKTSFSGAPGILTACMPPTGRGGTMTFVGSVPATAASATSWTDGVPYADAGDLTDSEPSLGPSCGSDDSGLADDASTDGETVPSSSIGDGSAAVPPAAPNPTAMVLRDDAPIAYVADNGVPLIHVIDLSNPVAPTEVGQLLATSAANPSRLVPVGGMALSPPTSDLRRYLYAIDQYDGTVMVFDATNPTPANPPQTPLHRPHPELSPFAPVDRLAFAAPVATMTFVLHDWPLVPPPPNMDAVHSYTGLLCNPNPNAEQDASGVFTGLGAYYRVDQATVIEPQGNGIQGFPHRLRGVFGFATLSNGSIVLVDVDDWDAPCRRPDPMELEGGVPDFQLGVLDVPQSAPTGPDDLDPYHAPRTVVPNGQTGVTQEVFYPVSAPNRTRSGFLLRNDPTAGIHAPYVAIAPQLFDLTGSPVAYTTNGAISLILPTALPAGFVDPSYIENPTDPGLNYIFVNPALGIASEQTAGSNESLLFPGLQTTAGVRVSYDDPTAHIDQDWTVTYEGALPTANNLFADMQSTDGTYETLTLTSAPASLGSGQSSGAQYCERGIEDWNVGQMRASAALDAMSFAGLPVSAAEQTLGQWTADYIEITDDLLVDTDGYWSETAAVNPCWQGLTLTDMTRLDDDSNPNIATIRYNACFATYNSSANDDTYYARDFPILLATDDTLVVGRFGWDPSNPEQTTNRTVVGPDPSNATFLKQAACCFHHQAGFKVRTGGEWVTVGQVGSKPGVGLLNHDGPLPGTGECGIRCDDPSKVLLNSRAFDVPPPVAACPSPPAGSQYPPPVERSSELAMRNPMLSFVMWGPCGTPSMGAHTLTTRDLQWRFSFRGGFTPLSMALQGTSPVPVSPQSMFYVAPFGQLAVIDGATNGQGLVLFDLNTLAFAHAPYF